MKLVQEEEGEGKQSTAVVASNRHHDIFAKRFLKSDTMQGQSSISTEDFFKKFAMYTPRDLAPHQGSSMSQSPQLLLDMMAEFTNPEIAAYLRNVRQLHLKRAVGPAEVVTDMGVYRLNGRTVMKLPMVKAWQDGSCGARKYMIGKPSRTDTQKNILIIGAKSCGKSCLIDGLANHALRVKWEDNFTLRITDPEENDSPNNQKMINVYTIPSTTETKLPFALNVVDMPGFSGIRPSRQDDHDAVDNMKKFMKVTAAHEVDTFSAVWFVYNARAKKIPPMYQRLYWELLQMYGDQIKSKITNVFTFSPKKENATLVMKALADSGLLADQQVSVSNMLAFNKINESPYSNAAKVVKDLQASWSNTFEAMDSMANRVELETPISLIPADKLERREQAIEGLRQLQNLVRIGCQRLQVMEQEKHMIEEKVKPADIIGQVPDFKYQVYKPVKMKRKLPNCGEQVTNCSVCFTTCHANCAIADDDAKKSCCAMGKDGFCTKCPDKCFWDQHFNRAFQIFLRMENQDKKFSDLPREYNVDGKEKAEVLMEAMHGTSEEAKMKIHGDITKAMRNVQIINEISGRRVRSSYEDCIDVIIHEEMCDGMADWENRVELLQRLKKEGRLGVRIKGKGEKEKML